MRNQLRLRHLPGRGVGKTDVAYLAGFDEIIERPQGLLHRREAVPVVQVVEVDVIGLQAPQRLVALRDDRLAARTAAVRIAGKQVAEELGRDDVAVARPALDEEVADDLLGMPLAPQPLSSPEVMTPRQNGLTRRPERPSVTYEFNGMEISSAQ
jgi:hypothetical protein